MSGGVRRQGLQALLIWCERVTRPYSSVRIVDLSSSFRDGLGFVAIIHRFRPELIASPDDLDADDVVHNNALAFGVAEEQLGIPSLLDPEDMADADTPDHFSVATYLAQLYHCFKQELVDELVRGIGAPTRASGSSTGNTPNATPPSVHRDVANKDNDIDLKFGANFGKADNLDKVEKEGSRRGAGLVSSRRAVFETPGLAKNTR